MLPEGYEDFVIGQVLDEPLIAPRVRKPRVGRHRSEAEIQREMLAFLNAAQRGCAVTTTGGRYLPTGTPDILASVNGRFVAVEVKRPGQRPTPSQLGQLRHWQAAGAVVGWACDLRQLEELLTHLDDPDWRNELTGPGDGR